MKNALLIVVGIVAALAGALLAGLVMWQEETESGLLIEEVVPPDALYWLEVRDGEGLWRRMKGTQAWRDLEASPLAAEFRDTPAMATAFDSLAALSDKVGYELDEANVLKFVGDEVGAAVYVADDGNARVLVVSRIDSQALARDLLAGDVDWRELQAELDRRVGLAGCDVSTVEVGDYVLATARKDDTEFHVALLQDLLVVSDSEQLVRDAIALRVADGDGSLARAESFRADMENVPEDAAATDWINVAMIREERKRIAAAAERPEAVESALEDLLGTIDAPSFARTLRLPGGDLYELDWQYSKDAGALFADDGRPDLRDLVPPDAAFYIEATSLRRVQDAWDGSSVQSALEDSWFARELEEWFDEPPDAPAMIDLDELFELVAPGIDRRTALSDRFARTFVASIARRSLSATFGNGMALGVLTPDEGDGVVLAAVRLDIDGRLLEATVRSLATVGNGERRGFSATYAGRRVAGLPDAGAGGVCWTAVGDVLVISTDLDALHGAVDRAVAGAGGGIGDALAELSMTDGPHVCVRAYANMKQLTTPLLRNMPEMEFTLGRFGYGVYDTVGFQVEIPDDFGHIELSTRARLADIDGPSGVTIYRNAPPVRPSSLDRLPEEAFLYGAYNVDFPSFVPLADALMEEVGAGEDWDLAKETQRVCGMPLSELLAALGPECAVAVVRSTDPASQELPPVPGLVLAVEAREPDTVEQALDAFVNWYKSEIEPPDEQPGLRLVRATTDGRDVIRIQIPDTHFVPAFGLVDGMLYAVSDESLLQEVAAVRRGIAPSIAKSRIQARILATGVSMDAHTVSRLDWGVMVDQLSAYTPQLAEAFVSFDAIPYPEYPDDGNDDEWERRLAAHEQAHAAAAREKEADVDGALDSTRFIDFMIATSVVGADLATGRFIVAFK